MKLPRRNFLLVAAGAAALPALSRIAWAQAYPTRPVRCIVGYAPGGGTDIFVRLVGQSLPVRLGQPFVIENRAGAASKIAKMPFPVHPHMLRHGCGYALANAGHDTRALQAWLGHKNIQHTVRYTELAPDRFKNFWR
jgi:tripartite-type tricarboxylate transporter receptor subunit TctC